MLASSSGSKMRLTIQRFSQFVKRRLVVQDEGNVIVGLTFTVARIEVVADDAVENETIRLLVESFRSILGLERCNVRLA